MPDISANLDTILGMGYSGFLICDGVPLLLLPSSTGEQDNLQKSQGAISPIIDLATGELVARDRRSLHPTFTVELTPLTLRLIFAACLDWRRANQFSQFHSAQIVVSNGEGYYTDELYFESVRIQAPEDGLITATFEGICWIWTETVGHVTPSIQLGVDGFGNPDYQPIPTWATRINHSGQAGIPRSFTIDFKNSWSFRQLCEGTAGPPTPRLVYPGALLSTLTMTVLAQRGGRPLESGSAEIIFGGVNVGPNLLPIQTLAFQFLYRDPQRTYESFGTQNEPVSWTSSWNTFGQVPVSS